MICLEDLLDRVKRLENQRSYQINQLSQELAALKRAHDRLRDYVAYVATPKEWEPQGADDQFPGVVEPFCPACKTCHHSICGCSGEPGPWGYVCT